MGDDTYNYGPIVWHYGATPEIVISATATFRFQIRTDETAPDDYDIFYWDLKDDRDGESLLTYPIIYTNQFEPVNEWIPIKIRIGNLSNWGGYTLRFSLSDTTDTTQITSTKGQK